MQVTRFQIVLLLLFSASLGRAAQDLQVLDAPENAFWHGESESWFVSNLGGGLSLDKDGVGWVARFDAEGKLMSPRWVDGLDAPTGMAAYGGFLFVADRGRVHEIDISSGKIRRVIELPGSEFVNDVAATADGRIFVSDTATNRIYEIDDGEASVWLETERLQSPNGLWVSAGNLIVATWGPMTDLATFATEYPGTLLRIEIATKAISPIGDGHPIANFDGVIAAFGEYYATDWTGGRLLRITTEGTVTTVLSGFEQLADLGFNPQKRQLGLPVMKDNRFILLSIDR
jgi:DNA-binding beta-propeller fold protein YncE